MSKHIDAQIAKKHRDIPQDTLPGIAAPTHGGSEHRKSRAPKAVAWAKCPDHVPTGKYETTALVRADNKTVVFRDHTKTVGRHSIPCPGSGQVWDGKTYVVRQ